MLLLKPVRLLLTASFAKLWAVISAHPIGAIITAVGIVAATNASNKAKEEARQATVELTNAYNQEKSSLDSQIEKYKELKETLDNGNLSTGEARSVKEQLFEIQKALIESYGSEASNIDLVNGKYKSILMKLICKIYYTLSIPEDFGASDR